MTWHNFDCSKPVPLEKREGAPERFHLFDDRSAVAIRAALAAKRPLLVKGEPGLGKTQLAEAAAVVLQRNFVQHVVDSRTEAQHLLWRFDAVERLAVAQLCAALGLKEEAAVREKLAESNFVRPGPLWWGFDWESASCHEASLGREITEPKFPTANGTVVLIDEIDKADSDVPNGLLEALGSGAFQPAGCEPVEAAEPTPLVVITTNEERVLPDAFIRRCLVLQLRMPEGDAIRSFLLDRGRAHFGGDVEDVLSVAADQLITDRANAVTPKPGVAEYLDLVRAVIELGPKSEKDSAKLIEELARFTTQKHSDVGP